MYPESLVNIPMVDSGDLITSDGENLQSEVLNAVQVALGETPYGPYASVAAAIAGKLDTSGGTLSGNIAMDGHRITGMDNPEDAQDGATRSYVDGVVVSPARIMTRAFWGF